MSSRVGARFRQRKLSTKHPLQIVREHEIETFAIDDDPQRHIPQVETGVEKAEEIEHHLQAVISASAAAATGGKVAQVFIPTPEAKPSTSTIPYDQLYPKSFSSPQTYIRFSSTVEDCIGPEYCVDEEDDVFLLNINQGKKADDAKLTEDILEEVITFFEHKTTELQPQAAIDHPPPPEFEQFEEVYDDEISADGRTWAKDVYSHWQTRKAQKGNRSLLAPLKFETGQETDDADAYVCFRRREVRQARKTRGRDAQVAEKLKKLRRELEEARQLVMAVNQRERLKKEHIETERKVFEQRSELKRVKIQQGITGEKGDDENLLVNQRPAPKPKARAEGAPRPTTLRINTTRSEGRAPENDLVQLSDLQEETAAAARRFVEDKIQQHRKWNNDWVDITWNPITPPPETASMGGFLPKLEEVQLPTPPASLHSESPGDHLKDVEMKDADADLPTPVSNGGLQEEVAARSMFRFASPPPDKYEHERPSFRRRYGRNGRLFVEKRRSRPFVLEKGVICDSDDESDSDVVVSEFDCHDTHGLSYRATLLATRPKMDPAAEQSRRAVSSGGDVAMANGQGTAGHSASRPQ
ncbi:hypothetical protein AAFC00_003470 [Neodothiora populina]|uniref:Enhancer of polycomb-like protein n=1 Tax=Neodothiora populina TaxID=2781224 RepID=A0ABR3PFG5_9PEZI